MTTNLDEFKAKFRLDELEIARTDHWTWSVRPVHSTLGAGVLSLNRFASSFAQVTDEESKDLGKMVKIIETRLGRAFAPEKMNYMMLMMVDDHVHFHVLPRYSSSKTFGGFTWQDSGWPKPPAMADYEDRATSSVLLKIRDELRKEG